MTIFMIIVFTMILLILTCLLHQVKNGMSALQASRKYGVPSRTLYDKVANIC